MGNFFFIPLIIGYLIGSINPAFFLGKLLRGINLREVGEKNLGAMNAKQILGPWPAAAVACIDLSKAVLAILFSSWLGFSPFLSYLSGFFAIVGHIFPFYLRFKGGQGVGASVGLLFYFLFLLFKNNSFYDFKFFLFSLIVLAVLSFSLFIISRVGEIIGLFVIPSFSILLLLNNPIDLTTGFLTVLFLFIFSVQILNIKNKKLLTLDKAKKQILHWRTLLRPLAAIFPVLYFYLSQKIILLLIGSVASFFILLDISRLLISGLNIFLFKNLVGLLKDKERKKFSSMTLFLSAVFILILAFPKNIAQAAIVFLIFGDLAAKFFGLKYGRKRFFTKTFEGSIAYFAFSLLAGFILSFFLPLPFWILFLGALTASIVEAFSIFGIDDNFTVGLISASVMLALSELV